MPNWLHLGSLWAPIYGENGPLYRFGSQAHPEAAQRVTFECFWELFWRHFGWIVNTFDGIFFDDFLVYFIFWFLIPVGFF